MRVLVVDDSSMIRAALTRLIVSDPGLRVVGHAGDGEAAVAAVAAQPVDVVVLDIEMPGTNGLAALPRILKARPGVRVIMASTLTTRGADATLTALRLGAADYIAKPGSVAAGDDAFGRELRAKLAALGRSPRPVDTGSHGSTRPAPTLRPGSIHPPRLLAIGSSTGGPQALFQLFQCFTANLPVPVIITQHMPTAFMPILAEQLTRQGGMACELAQEGGRLLPGRAYLAPGERHLLVRDQDGLRAGLSSAPAENHCRPSVDPMLRSAALATGGRVLVLMLTGMGSDGLAGTRAVVEAGGAAIAQDEASSVVWGMPGAVAQAGLCHAILPIPGIASAAQSLLLPTRGRPCR